MKAKSKLSVRNLITYSIYNFKHNFWGYIGFEGIYKGVTSFLIVPFMFMILNYFIHNNGFSAITNKQILNFGMSKQGMMAMLIMGAVSFFVVFIEQIGLVIISYQSHFNKKISTKDTFIYSIKNIPAIMSLGSVQILLYLLFIIPFSNLGIRSNFIKNIQIPKFIEDTLFKSLNGSLLIIFITLIVTYFVVTWIFALHCTILEKKSFSDSIKKSKNLVKGYFFKILFTIFLLNVLVGIITFIIVIIYVSILIMIIQLIDNNFIVIPLVAFISVISTGVSVFISLIMAPLNTLMITCFYFEIRSIKENDELWPIDIEESSFENSFEKILYKNRKNLILLSSIIVAVSTINISYEIYDSLNEKYNIQITAHRGSSIKAPENSLSAIKYAIKDKADYAEIDVQETKDGKIVLLHDKSIKRVTGIDKNIWEVDYEQLKNLDAGSWYSDEFKGEKIPLLEDIIKVSKNKIKLNIEIKTNGHENNLAENVVKIIEKNNLEDKCVVTSITYNALEQVEKLNPQIKTGYIVYMAVGDISELDVDFYSMESSRVTPKIIKNIHNKNKHIHVWTVNTDEDIEKFNTLKVDNIITDYPERVRKIIYKTSKDDKNLDKILNSIFY